MRLMPIQKVAVGSIGTTRAVDSVTLGLKSTVYKQINSYPNVQEFTGPDQVNGFAKDNAQFQLGTTTSYYGRISLFRMELKAGEGKWFDYCGDTVFAVYGNNPQPSYNQIQIIPSLKRPFCKSGLFLSAAMLGSLTSSTRPKGLVVERQDALQKHWNKRWISSSH